MADWPLKALSIHDQKTISTPISNSLILLQSPISSLYCLSSHLEGLLRESWLHLEHTPGPSASHIREVELAGDGGDDVVIAGEGGPHGVAVFIRAFGQIIGEENDFIIVTKDDDFEQRSVLLGHPPKVIWIRLGNCQTADVVSLLLNSKHIIHAFGDDQEKSILPIP